MLVYRVEDGRGGGPYRGNGMELYDMAMRHTNSVAHPPPERDGLTLDYDQVCGFASIERFLNWFSEFDRTELQGHCFRLCAYEATNVRRGAAQLMFDPESAKLIDVFDPLTLIPIAVLEA